MQENPLQNKKVFYINRDSLELFLEFLYKYDIIYIYIFVLLYGILAILFLKFKVKVKLIGKTQQLLIHTWSTVEK